MTATRLGILAGAAGDADHSFTCLYVARSSHAFAARRNKSISYHGTLVLRRL